MCMHLYLYTHTRVYIHIHLEIDFQLCLERWEEVGRIQMLDWRIQISARERQPFEQRGNKTKHIVGGENTAHGQEEARTLRARLSPSFIDLFQILMACQQVADLCSVLGETQEEEGPSLPIWDQILQCGRCTVGSGSL